MVELQTIMHHILSLFPNATISIDSEGQLIIHTNMTNPGDDPDVFVDMEPT